VAHSSGPCCHEKQVSIIQAYPECVFVFLDIENKMRYAPYCHLWHVRFHNMLLSNLINGMILEKKSYLTKNVCLEFL